MSGIHDSFGVEAGLKRIYIYSIFSIFVFFGTELILISLISLSV
jgi:hypothetical protein